MLGKLFRAATAIFFIATSAAMAQQYGPGASATEIRLGQTVPFSGPVSVAGVVGHASLAYFDAINKAGGINGRQIKLIVLDDGYSPPKTVEATRRLVEDENVLMMYGSVGTPTNAAVEKYLNVRRRCRNCSSPRGQAASGMPRRFPGPSDSYPATCRKAGRWRATSLKRRLRPGSRCSTRMTISARIFARGSGQVSVARRMSMIVSEQTYEVADPTVDSQLIAAKVSGANVFYFAGTQKAGAEQIRGVRKLGWAPLHLVCSIASSVEGRAQARWPGECGRTDLDSLCQGSVRSNVG